MFPPISYNNLHLVNETKMARFFPSVSFSLPAPDPLQDRRFLKPRGREPPREPVLPHANIYL